MMMIMEREMEMMINDIFYLFITITIVDDDNGGVAVLIELLMQIFKVHSKSQ